MALGVEDLRDARRLAEVIRERLWSLVEGNPDLEVWYDGYVIGGERYEALAQRIVESTPPEELEERVEEILGALPRYVELVSKAIEAIGLHAPRRYELSGFPYRALEILKSLSPLSRKLRKTGLKLKWFQVYVGDWVEALLGRWFRDIDELLSLKVVLPFIVDNADEIARHIDSPRKREAFLRLVELARRGLEGWRADGILVDIDDPRHVYIGDAILNVLDPGDLPEMIPHMDALVRLYDGLASALRSAGDNEAVLREMEEVARSFAESISREADRLARSIRRRLRNLVRGDPDLEYVYKVIGRYGGAAKLARRLVESAGTQEELEKRVKEVLEALPRYAGLAKKVLKARELHELRGREVEEFSKRAVEIFKSLSPLSGEKKEIGTYLEGHNRFPIYVVDWIKVLRYGELRDIDQLANPLEVVNFIVATAGEIAKHIDDEEKREVFLKLVELSRQRLGEWYAGEVFIGGKDPRYVYVGGEELDALDPEYLPDVASHLDTLERLYDSILGALKNVEHGERVLEEMRRVARPYIVARVLG